jgi:oligopeptidase A
MNPLLNLQPPFDFAAIRPEHIQPAIDQLIVESEANLDRIRKVTDLPTFHNTLLALEEATVQLGIAFGTVAHLEGVVTTPELRTAFSQAQPKVAEFYSKIALDTAIWERLKSFAATAEATHLGPLEKRLLEKTMDGFRRAGADLDVDGKVRLAAIEVELARITTKFMQNVLDSTNAFELYLDESTIAGLPESAIAAARNDAEAKGKPGFRFTLQAPSYVPVLTYLEDRSVRETLYREFQTRATTGEHANEGLIVQILKLRREKAQMLGFADFADLVLQDRMSKSGANAQSFLEDLKSKTKDAFTKENAALLEFARQLTDDAQLQLQPWDVGFYSEKMRQALYEFDEEELRPYFAVDQVVDGMFAIVSELYGVKIVSKPEVVGWHPEVKYFELIDSDATVLGGFYSDWFPRESKRGGAWMDCLVTGGPEAKGFRPHVGLICGNMTPPLGDKPALLTHREVETIWHEFGHLLHQLLSRVAYRGMAGTNVAWDFVELPSQIMENWCWERAALDRFARHFETGQPIPTELFEKMKRARTFRSANAQMRQLSFGLVDLKLHREYQGEQPVTFARDIMQTMSPAPLPPEHAMLNGFSHLFSSSVAYASGYYSYKWAEVLDADAFTRFQREGIFSSKVGNDFRNAILGRGNSDDPAQLFREFMGRDPDPSALMIRQGLATTGGIQ